jgi:hypothetical protein
MMPLSQIILAFKAYVKTLKYPDLVVILAKESDWNILEETLRVDSESGAFEPGLRSNIVRALSELHVEYTDQ